MRKPNLCRACLSDYQFGFAQSLQLSKLGCFVVGVVGPRVLFRWFGFCNWSRHLGRRRRRRGRPCHELQVRPTCTHLQRCNLDIMFHNSFCLCFKWDKCSQSRPKIKWVLMNFLHVPYFKQSPRQLSIRINLMYGAMVERRGPQQQPLLKQEPTSVSGWPSFF